jgi:hypothetical protein
MPDTLRANNRQTGRCCVNCGFGDNIGKREDLADGYF